MTTKTLEPIEYARRAAATGAALWGRTLPTWYRDIDKKSLDMAQACSCIVGQIGQKRVNLDLLGDIERASVYDRESPYSWILRRLGVGRHEISQEHNGFVPPLRRVRVRSLFAGGDGYYWRRESACSWADLQQAWIEEIDKRLAADAVRA